MSRSTPWLAKLLLVLFGILSPLIAAEIGLRLYRAYVKIRSPYQAATNPKISFLRKPHADKEINSLGLRDREYVFKGAPGVFRIIVLGDSVTAGFHVDFADTYPKRLESLLNEASAQYEVINFGVEQYSTAQEVALFEELGLAMRPNLVIIGYVLNDPTSDGSINDFFREDHAASLVFDWLTRAFRKAWGLRDSRREIEGCRQFDYFSQMHCDATKWAAVSASFGELRELSAHHGFAVLLVIFPLLQNGIHASFRTYPWTEVHEAVVREATANGFATLDLLPYFAERSPAELKIGPTDELHPNGLGNQIAATAIYRALLRLRLVAPGRR